MNHNWIEITVKTSSAILEEISDKLFEMGCSGVEENNNFFKIYFADSTWTKQLKQQFFDFFESRQIQSADIYCKVIKTENWNENWKKNFRTFHLGQNIVIQPDWESFHAQKNEKVITIAPKMAFGTGHHETTQLILKHLEKEIKPGISILDAGTGSGILAIYVALCDAGKIVAFDNDQQAIENARENAALNGVSDKINLHCATLQEIKKEPFDLISANINKNILLDLAPDFYKYANIGTKLILSGLLNSDKEKIKECYENNSWIYEKSDQLNEWISLQFVYSKEKL